MTPGLIEVLSMVMVGTSVAAVEARRLRNAVAAYVAHALLIVALLLCLAVYDPALYWCAGIALVAKAILIPWLLFGAIPKTADREERPLVGFVLSVAIASLVMLGFYRLTHTYADRLVPVELVEQEVFLTNLAVAATVFVLGLYCMLTRRDALKTVIGLCLLGNAVHLSLVSIGPGLPGTALVGAAMEVVVTVFLLVYVIDGVRRKFGTTDTFKLRDLRW